jgi:uncharacterized protein involved in cysteine biosynthesis
MLAAFTLAVGDAFAPEQRRALLLSLGLALLLLAGLWVAAAFLIDGIQIGAFAWLASAIHVLGDVAALVVAWMLFPAMTALVLGFFLDGVIASIERAHYPGLPPARRIGVGEAVTSALRLVVLACVLNLVVLPLYLLPGLNLVIYYGLNGYLVGREYFELIALRRMDRRAARLLWRWRRGSLLLAGVAIAFLLSLPFVNLVAPVIGAAFLLHLFERLRRAAPAGLTSV